MSWSLEKYSIQFQNNLISIGPVSYTHLDVYKRQPYERRIIHSALQNDKYVFTRSEGEEPFRHVVISLKREERRERRPRPDRKMCIRDSVYTAAALKFTGRIR